MTEDQLREAVSIADLRRALSWHLDQLAASASDAMTGPSPVVSDIVDALQWKDSKWRKGECTRLLSPNAIREIRSMIISDLSQQRERAERRFAEL